MKKGYWIVRADVSDMTKFSDYASKTPEALGKYKGQFLVRAGQQKIVEGQSRARNSVIEFPSYKDALDCWNSEEYQNARQIRIGAAELDIVVIEGP